jgi:Zn-dependent protease with chaperone function
LPAALFFIAIANSTTISRLHVHSNSTASPALPVNDLAAAYQPRRVWAAAVSIAWNLSLAALFTSGGGAWKLYARLAAFVHRHHLPQFGSVVVLYLLIFFGAYALLNYPIDLWFGYLEERQFGLAKDGIRAWTRDWLSGVIQHGALFLLGSTAILILQSALPTTWLLWLALLLLALFLLTGYFAVAFIPEGLFHLEPIDDSTRGRLESIIKPQSLLLPSLIVYSAPHLRDFSGGLIGLGNRQAMLISRSTLSAASDGLLRFVLLHDMGHRRYHHLLLSTLAGWAWVMLGLCASKLAIHHWSPNAIGLPPYIAWLALTLSLWMATTEPFLAYLGRRLEYQADRFYLRHGGTVDEMRAALDELSRRNLARTEGLPRRQTIFHPLPTVWNRLHAAELYARTIQPGKDRPN